MTSGITFLLIALPLIALLAFSLEKLEILPRMVVLAVLPYLLLLALGLLQQKLGYSGILLLIFSMILSTGILMSGVAIIVHNLRRKEPVGKLLLTTIIGGAPAIFFLVVQTFHLM